MCKDLLRQTRQQVEDREHLRKLLDRPSGGAIIRFDCGSGNTQKSGLFATGIR
jgi:hypothetical protein